MRTNYHELYEAYVEELTIYTRWLNKTQPKYGDISVFGWDQRDYEVINSWNDAMKMTERVLGFTEEEIRKAEEESKIRALVAGRDTPWNYWKETTANDIQ